MIGRFYICIDFQRLYELCESGSYNGVRLELQYCTSTSIYLPSNARHGEFCASDIEGRSEDEEDEQTFFYSKEVTRG